MTTVKVWLQVIVPILRTIVVRDVMNFTTLIMSVVCRMSVSVRMGLPLRIVLQMDFSIVLAVREVGSCETGRTVRLR